MNPIIQITRPIVDKFGKTKAEIAAEMKRTRTLSPGCFLVMDASGSDSRGSPLAVAWVVVTPEGVLAESGSRLLRPDDATQLLRLGPRLPATRYHIEQSPYLQSKTLAKLTALVKKVRSLSGGSSHQLMFASEEGRTLLQGILGKHGRDIAAAAAGYTSMNKGLHKGCVQVAESLLN